MSSSVFFKFKSQKEPSRVTFDGTGISVFELKRQIITINRLGDGTDFDLAISNQDTNEEYDDDTTIIPRSTSVSARRLPPSKPGRGTAARYVSGKMPTSALPNAGRREKNFGTTAQPAKKPDNAAGKSGILGLTGDETEEERMAAMFQASSELWDKTQEHLANQTPVHRSGNFKRGAAPAPSHPPPSGYVCYRCGEKGHWIQQCPTNADPSFDGRPRVKRTTGIPRSFLKAVEKPVPTADDGTSNSNNPSSVMVNADGEYVVAMPDLAQWESYQKKAGATTKTDAPQGNKEWQERGIECPMCHKLLRDAVKTPCCGKVYCEECIQNALLESDFVCPTCEKKEILLDALITDSEARSKLEAYQKKKETGVAITSTAANTITPNAATPIATAPVASNVSATNSSTTSNEQPKAMNEKSKSPVIAPTAPAALRAVSQSATPAGPRSSASMSPSLAKSSATTPVPSVLSKKRSAEDEIGPKVPRGPAAMRNAQQQQPQPQPQNFQNGYGPGQMYNNNASQPTAFHHQIPSNPQPYGNGYNNFGGNMHGMGMGVRMANGMNGGINGMNPMQMNEMGPGMAMNGGGMNHMGGGMNHMHGMGHMNGMNGYYPNGNNGYGYNNPQAVNNGYVMNNAMNNGIQGLHGMNSGGMMPNQMNGGQPNNFAMQQQLGQFGTFPNQQKTVFSEPFPSEEDSPYMRKPVNPHRHARPKRIRPSDFKALGGEMI